MRSAAPYLCLLALLMSAEARAQIVREDSSGAGRLLRAATNQAKDKKPGWPNLYDGDPGTVVIATFGLRDADLTLVTADTTPERLLNGAQTAAQDAGYPQADFLTFSGTRFESVDIELNDSLVKTGESRTEIAIKLGRLIRALERAGVPKPIALAVRVDPLTTAILDGKILPTGTTLLLPSDIPDAATLARTAERPPWAVAVAWTALVIGVALLLLLWTFPLRLLKSKPTAPEPTEPDAVQAKYDRTKPWTRLLPILPLIPLAFLTLGKPWIEYLFAVVATVFPSPPMWAAVAIPLPMLAVFPIIFVLKKRRNRGAPTPNPTAHPEDDEGPLFSKGIILLPIMLLPGIALLGMRTVFPHFLSGLDPFTRILLAIGPGIVALVVFMILALRDSSKSVTVLAPGDPVYDAARELATQAGVKIRKVQLRRSAAPNAFADLANNVGVTTRLKRDFPPEEVRAILAHEIGHLRHRHVWRGFIPSILFVAAWIGLHYGADDWVRARASDGVYALWNSPLGAFFVLPFLSRALLGRGSRRREFEADRFAAEAVGDPEIVASALRRVHTLSGVPGRLRPEDELLSTHPSLARRIAALTSEDRSRRAT